MKKYLIIAGCATLLAFMIALFSGCSSSSIEKNNISDLRYGIFDCQCENYSATFVYGLRETPYIQDGISNNMIEFGIISVIFESTPQDTETISFCLKIDNISYSGNLEKNPYTSEFMADIGKTCNETSNIELMVMNDEIEESFVQLSNKSQNWAINYVSAQEIGISALETEIKSYENNKKNYEIYVKIISQQKTNFGTYFWNVSVICSDGTKHSVLFSTNNKDILVKN